MAHYLLADEIERRAPEARLVADRIVREVEVRVLEPYRRFDDPNPTGCGLDTSGDP